YIAGTSTGAIIAACLSLGLRVSDVLGFYIESGPLMFSKARLFRRFWYKYDSTPLAKMLQRKFGADTEFGSEKLKTLLMLVLRDATTDSPWPLSNNPNAKYNTPLTRPGCNLKFPLCQLVRASTAAPTFFPAESIVINEKRKLFVDGGMTLTSHMNMCVRCFVRARRGSHCKKTESRITEACHLRVLHTLNNCGRI